MPIMMDANERILFFDGVCNLCNFFVNFLIARDGRLVFAPLQGETARQRFGGQVPMSSVIYLRDGKIWTESAAVLRVLQDLGGGWRFVALGWLVPGFLRDPLYRVVAENRYRLFGKRSTCRMPTIEERARFRD